MYRVKLRYSIRGKEVENQLVSTSKATSASMKCSNCNKEITDDFIPAANSNFCSEICHLRFWKEEMPNLGGQLITAESLEKLTQLNGQAQKDEYTRIVQFVIDNFESTPFMRLLQDES